MFGKCDNLIQKINQDFISHIPNLPQKGTKYLKIRHDTIKLREIQNWNIW